RTHDRARSADVHQAGAEHGQRGQERHAHRRRSEAKPDAEMTPFLVLDAAGLDVLADDLRQAPRQPDPHPGGHDLRDRAGHDAPLALVAHEVAREREAARPATEQGADEAERRAGEEDAAERDVIAVLDASCDLLERLEFVARRPGLLLEALSRRAKVEFPRSDRHAGCARTLPARARDVNRVFHLETGTSELTWKRENVVYGPVREARVGSSMRRG